MLERKFKPFTRDKKYFGKYIAMPSFAERKVVASGKNPKEVIARAVQKGFPHPVLMFMPEKNTVHA